MSRRVTRAPTPPVLFLLVLVALGVYAAGARALILTGHESAITDLPRLLGTRLFPALAGEFIALEAHYARIAGPTLVHVVLGGLFLSLGALQFSARIRSRRPRLHRASGRALAALAGVVGTTGIWMGVVAPFSTTERVPTAVLGTIFLVAPVMGIAAIRRGEVARHREWMIRFYAAALASVAVRLLSPGVVALVNPATFHAVIGTTFWAGLLATQLAAELWIRATRAPWVVHAIA